MIRHLRMPLIPDPVVSSPDYPVYVPKYSAILWDTKKCNCSIGASQHPARGMLKTIPWITLAVNDDCAACALKIKELLSRLDVSEIQL